MTEALLRSLHEPRRNKYFYGKLLDVAHFQMEQCYGLDKRWMLNRLALGSGVLCGLGVTVGADGTLCILPGVAIDGSGREIIVSAPHPGIDPAQPTDAKGLASGDKLTTGQSTIYLCYTECDAEPTLVYVSECDGVATNAPSTVVERYRVIVRPGLPGAEPVSLTAAERDAIFPVSPAADFDRRIATEQTLGGPCPAAQEMSCVVLATVTLPSNGAALSADPYTYRAEVFSNTVLFELIAALADRVDACCTAMHPVTQQITVADGDDQSAEVSAQLGAPLHLLVTDSDGKPVAGAAVHIATSDADGQLSIDEVTFAPELDATADAAGTVAVQWRLGSVAGPQHFTAKLASGAAATAHASATAAPLAQPPVVLRLDPKNAATVGHDWAGAPRIRIRFDQDMNPAGLANPDPWLRAWFFPQNADGFLDDGRRIPLAAGEPGDGAESSFRGELIDLQRFAVIVMMRGSSPEIVSAGPGLALDAEYQGTALDRDQLDRLWNSDVMVPDDAFRAGVRDGGGALPSGDASPGGEYFHAFFLVESAQ